MDEAPLASARGKHVSTARIRPGAPSVTASSGSAKPRRLSPRRTPCSSRCPPSCPAPGEARTLRPSSVIPQAQSTASRGSPACRRSATAVDEEIGDGEFTEDRAPRRLRTPATSRLGHLADGAAAQDARAARVAEGRFDVPGCSARARTSRGQPCSSSAVPAGDRRPHREIERLGATVTCGTP